MMKFFALRGKSLHKFGYIMLFILMIISCKKEETIENLPLFGPDQEFYALSDNSLLKFNAKNVKTQLSKIAITGLGTSEKLVSIDFRPATGELYGVTNASKLYIINVISGIARVVSSTAFTPALTGTTVSLDFNPAEDRIRIISNTGQNLSLNPETGVVVATGTAISSGSISGVAYINSIAGAATTTLYDIDPTAKTLYKQDSPNDGVLSKIGNLELDFGSSVSFDISPSNSSVLAVGKTGDSTKLFTVDLSTGKAKLSGKFPIGTAIQGIAIPANPAAYAVTFDATSNQSSLLIFNPLTADAAVSKLITGLQTGETVLGMDMRPLNGQIYALGSTGRLYTINMGSGAFTQVGTGTLSPALSGVNFGFDFNPVEDIIRVVSNTGQNLRINPTTAAVNVDATINPATATLSAAAYSSNFVGATTTKLYVMDYTGNKLYSQDANLGTLTAIGDLSIDVEGSNGFDIISAGTGDTGYAILSVAGVSKVYSINLLTGAATSQRDFSKTVTAFTLGLRF
ncbi:DUF4394 domain-containing protein [Pedobacter sp. LMG 31464]|uniref:DUF4394 domain-containing protein n=1 Tax=Pedobacter planticolens TaxID=2679964 RepID=A0A923IVK7_9SPHI|nr:DUF4394 domain-containing protein [Pedobacter planticolens]MBB2146131.1 DUF4394 domain-containing protein [Pedobacter planticolens]